MALTKASGPDFVKEFILETNASFKGLDAVLSLEDNMSKVPVTAYPSRMLKPSEKSMPNYNSATLELLALKWTATKMFQD